MKQDKNAEAIKTYEELIKFFSSLGTQAKDDNLVSISKKYVESFKEDLNDLQKDSELKKEDNEKNDKPTEELEKEPEYLPYIRNFYDSSYGNVNVRLDFEKLMKQFTEDMKNPNETLVGTFIKNYIDFVDSYELDRDLMYNFIHDRFEKHENGKDYIPLLEELYDLDKEKDLTEDNKKSTDEPTNSKDKTEDEKTIDENGQEKSKTEDKTDPNTEAKENDDKGKAADNSENNLDEKDKKQEDEKRSTKVPDLSKNKPLKIVSTKKTQFSKAEKIGLSLLAVMCMANISNPIFLAGLPITIGFIIHKLRKNYKYRNYELEEYLKTNDLNISKDGLLTDKDGNVITETTVEKERYKHLKKQLTRMGAMKSKVLPFSYMWNKLTSKLVESKEERKQRKMEKKYEKERINRELEGMDYLSRRNKEREDEIEEFDDEYSDELEEENIMKKGLGRVR